MRASEPLVLKIYVKSERHGEVAALAETVRARADEAGLTDVTLHHDDAGPVIRVTGEEANLRRFWAGARDFGDLGLMVLQPE